MEYFYLKRSLINGDLEYNCILSYDKDQKSITLHLCDTELGDLDFSGVDTYDALKKVREFLEDKGFLLLCAGSMPNVYPSGMSRNMTNGRIAYVHTNGKKPTINDTIDIFMPAGKLSVGTIEQQDLFMRNLRDYFKNSNKE